MIIMTIMIMTMLSGKQEDSLFTGKKLSLQRWKFIKENKLSTKKKVRFKKKRKKNVIKTSRPRKQARS